MPVATDDVVWLDVLPSMGRFKSTLETEAGGAANSAGAKAGEGFSSKFAKTLKVGAALGAAFAVVKAGDFLKDSISEASDLNESLNAVQVTFGKNANGILALGKNAATAMGLSNNQFNSLAVQFSAFAQTIAGKGGDVVGTMKTLTGRGADFASVMNLEVNDAMELFQSGLAGETEPLRKYGIDLSAAAVGNWAVAHGIVANANSMTEAQKVQARYGSLMEQTAKVQGDFTNTSDQLANSQRILGARWDDIQAKVGAKVLPILTKLTGWVSNTGLPLFMKLGGWLRDTLSPVFSEIAGGITAFGAAWKANDGDITSSGFPGFMERLAFVAHQAFDYFQTNVLPVLQSLGGWLINTGIPAIRDFATWIGNNITPISIVAGIIGTLLLPHFIRLGVVALVTKAQLVGTWIATQVAAVTSSATSVASTYRMIAAWVAARVAALSSFGQTIAIMGLYAAESIASAARSVAAWVVAQAQTVGSLAMTAAGFVAQGAVMVGSMIATAAGVVASWVTMGVQSLIRAAQMAAAWVIAMGPVGWVIAAVVGLVALIIANWDTVVAWTKAAWNALVGAIKAAMDWVWNSVIQPVLSFISAAWNGLMTGMNWAWANILKPALDAIAAAATWLWNTVLKAIFWVIKTEWQGLMAAMNFVWNSILKPTWDAISAAIGWLWNSVLKPVFGFISDAWKAVGTAFGWAWNNLIKPIFDTFSNVVETVKNGFNNAVQGIKGIWEGLKEILRAPVQWVVDVVWNNGLRKLWNWINNLWGGDDLAAFSFSTGGTYDPNSGGGNGRARAYATGGVLPGYTPGRDVHRFFSPTGGRLELSGGEAIMRPEFTRAIGRAGVDQLNALAMKEGAAGLAKVLGGTTGLAYNARRGDPPSPQAFAKGGVVDLPGWLEWPLKFIPGGGFITDALKAINGGGEGGGQWGNMIWGVVKKTASSLWDKAKSLFGGGEGGDWSGASGGFANALAFARSQVGKPYVWGATGPGGYDCSGFMSAITNVIRGKSPFSRVGATGSFPWAGFRSGMDGPFTIGSSRNTGDGIGHMAGTLLGVNVESRGGSGVHVGPSARGAHDRLFGTRAALFDNGGLWEPGTAGFNFTGNVERVLTPQQDNYFRKFVDVAERHAGSDRQVHLYTPDIPHAIRALREEEQQREALAPTW